MKKSTHRGHCQICERLQAVNPDGTTLAKHGYKVEHGFFNGTCPGSDHSPYEISADLLPPIAENMEAIAKRLFAKALSIPSEVPAVYSSDIQRLSDATLQKNLDGTFTVVSYKRRDVWAKKTAPKEVAFEHADAAKWLGEVYKDSEYFTPARIQETLESEWKDCVDYEVRKTTQRAEEHAAFAARLRKRFADWTLQLLIAVDTKPAKTEVKVGDKFEQHGNKWEVVGFTEKQNNFSNRYTSFAKCKREHDGKVFNLRLQEVRKALTK